MRRLRATTVYLDEKQKRGLYRLAKARGSHFSEEIRTAIDQHLTVEGHPASISSEELSRLARAADQSVERMLARLDETNRRLDTIIRAVGRSNRRALRGRP